MIFYDVGGLSATVEFGDMKRCLISFSLRWLANGDSERGLMGLIGRNEEWGGFFVWLEAGGERQAFAS